MSRVDPEQRTALLVARSTLQRERFAQALSPWQARADRADRVTLWMRSRAGWLGFVAGAAFGFVAAARPRLLVASARALAATWPLWLRARSR